MSTLSTLRNYVDKVDMLMNDLKTKKGGMTRLFPNLVRRG
jgi:hypothetical protein